MIAPSHRLIWICAAATGTALAPVLGWVVFLVIACVAAVDAWMGVRRLGGIRATAPARVRLTRDVPDTVPISIESPVAMALRLAPALSDAVVDASVPVGASSVPWTYCSSIRGDHRLTSVHLETLSQMGLWSVRGTRPLDCTLSVYPNLRGRATAGLFLRTADPGARLRRQRGKGKEFENLRHYLPGDSFEDVHWKATARRAFPMVKLYSIEHAQEVYAIVDSSRLSARDAILDSYVDAVLHLALVADKQRDRFGLVTFADRTHTFVRARNGKDHFRLCREAIYRLQPERVSPDFREVFTTLQTNLRRRALLVFFTSLDDALLAETFERDIAMLARRHLVLVHVMPCPEVRPLFTHPPDDTESAYAALAGQMAWNRMRKLQIGLQNLGVRLSFVDPERIRTQVSNAYLEVKRRQAL